MPCSFDEKAIAAGEQYAVSLKDFYSFLVQGKTFAYHALYQIVRIKDGKITTRLDQPVSLYYIDAAGQGEFELAQGALARLQILGCYFTTSNSNRNSLPRNIVLR